MADPRAMGVPPAMRPLGEHQPPKCCVEGCAPAPRAVFFRMWKVGPAWICLRHLREALGGLEAQAPTQPQPAELGKR